MLLLENDNNLLLESEDALVSGDESRASENEH
jgi:hypothetical protein